MPGCMGPPGSTPETCGGGAAGPAGAWYVAGGVGEAGWGISVAGGADMACSGPVGPVFPEPAGAAGAWAASTEPAGAESCPLQSSPMRNRTIVSAESICSSGSISKFGPPVPVAGGAETGAPQLGQMVLPAGRWKPHCPQCSSNVLDIARFCLSSTRMR